MQTPMRAVPVAIALLALCGCNTVAESQSEAGPDGVPCARSAGASAVWIDVEYSGDSVHPSDEECAVDPGTRITWRSPEAFQLRFLGASPGGPREPAEVISADSGGQYKIRITADNDGGRYEYDIISRGVIVDPAIIIR